MSLPLRIVYAGTPEFSVPALQALINSAHEVVAVYTQPDRPAGRGRELKASPVKQAAEAAGIAVYQPQSLKADSEQQQLAALQADLMVVTAYGLILPENILCTPRLGCINIHASLLPRWRGAAPIQRAILAGDDKTGITIMQMDKGLDTGDMLAVAECDIAPDDTGSRLHDRLMQLGADTLMQVLPAIADGSVQPQKQDDALATYAHKLSKAEAEIDWTQSAQQIERAVRAYNAWPVAFSFFQRPQKKSQKKDDRQAMLRIWRAQARPGGDKAAPGTVLAETAQGEDAGIDVACGEGVLRILELQAEGKRRMAAGDFLHAGSLLGQQLGRLPAETGRD